MDLAGYLGRASLPRPPGPATGAQPLENREQWLERPHAELGVHARLPPCLPPPPTRSLPLPTGAQPRTSGRHLDPLYLLRLVFCLRPPALQTVPPLPPQLARNLPATLPLPVATPTAHPRPGLSPAAV